MKLSLFHKRLVEAFDSLAEDDVVLNVFRNSLADKGEDPLSQRMIRAALEQVLGANWVDLSSPEGKGPNNRPLKELVVNVARDLHPIVLDVYEAVLSAHGIGYSVDTQLRKAVRASLAHYTDLPKADHPG